MGIRDALRNKFIDPITSKLKKIIDKHVKKDEKITPVSDVELRYVLKEELKGYSLYLDCFITKQKENVFLVEGYIEIKDPKELYNYSFNGNIEDKGNDYGVELEVFKEKGKEHKRLDNNMEEVITINLLRNFDKFKEVLG